MAQDCLAEQTGAHAKPGIAERGVLFGIGLKLRPGRRKIDEVQIHLVGAMMFRFLLVAGVLFATCATADRRQFANVTFDLPEHWFLGVVRDDKQFILNNHPDDLCEYCHIYILKSLMGQTNLNKFLRGNLDKYMDEDDRGRLVVMMPPKLFDVDKMQIGMTADLPPEASSFITRVCGSGFHIRWFRFGQARRARSPQIAQASGALLRV
ncbi:hypothetical protein, partial [Halovulum sp. GXIMD14793]